MAGLGWAAAVLGLLPALVVPGWAGADSVATEPPPSRAVEKVLRIAPAASPPADRHRQVTAWYRAYRRDSAGVTGAWSSLLRALRPVRGDEPATPRTLVLGARSAGGGPRELDERGIEAACAALRRELGKVGERPRPQAPDPVVAWHLRRAMTALASSAAVCDADRYFLLGYRLQAAGRAYVDFSRALRRYRLPP